MQVDEYSKMYKLNEALEALFAEKSVRCELYTVRKNELAYEIIWGDWKHDHARFDHVVGAYLKEKGIRHSIERVTTQEDGSDCYSAVHIIHFF